jgi:predicted lipoprotein with Yx(FWY)xxD motif
MYLLPAVLGLAVLSACGQATAGTSTPVEVAAVKQEQPPGTVSLNAAEIPGLGAIVTDQDGLTLYRFDQDTANPSSSNCDATCVAQWPPVIAEGEIVVAGLDKELVGTVPRVDGDTQVTLDGWPLYRFAGDREPGDARGDGVDGIWHATTPAGAGSAPEPLRITGKDLPDFGPALTDQDGFTLYLFTKDTQNPSVSTCYGPCARTWPPVVVRSTEPELAGVDPALVGEVAREDGERQLTVNGWPVYRYAKDTAPGQTNGHGIDNTWFVIEPAGCKSAAPTQPPTRSPALATGN